MPKKGRNIKKESEFLKKENFAIFIMLIIMFIIILFSYYYMEIDKYDERKKSESFENKITVIFESNLSLIAEIANTPFEKSRGLMYRNELKEDSGMLFNFSSEKSRGFWMKNTKIPLDIIFLDKDKKIVDIIENMEPCVIEECPTYTSEHLSMYAIEVNSGYVSKNSIKIGQKASF